jgi:hypothetical protein
MSRIDCQTLDTMFLKAGVTKEDMYDALRSMGPKELKPPLRKEWSPENPTRNFCYVIAEFVLNYCAPAGSKAYSLEIPGDLAKHYYVVTPLGGILDLAAEQFADYGVVDYKAGKKTHFQHPSPSRRARLLAELLGYDA